MPSGDVETPTTGGPIRLAVVNDFEVVTAGLRALLAPFADRVVVVEADHRLPVRTQVDLVLIDTFGDVHGDGIGIADLAGGDAKVVVYAWNTDEDAVREALDAGASGCLSKALSSKELVDALEEVHAGVVVTSPPAHEADAPGLPGWSGESYGLSAREIEMIALVAKGLSNKEIASASFLGVNTVKTYLRTAYRKLGIQRRSQAVAWAIDNGLVPRTSRQILPPEDA